MNEVLTSILKEVISKISHNNHYVFASYRTGKPYTDIKTCFPNTVKKIGLAGFRFHDLRHTWCSQMCALGVDETTIMEIGGGKTWSMLNRYLHLSMNHDGEDLEKLTGVPLKFPSANKPTHTLKLTALLNSVTI